MSRKRNYRREYAERIQRGRRNGLSKSAARGHPTASDLSKPTGPIDRQSPLEKALTRIKRGETQKSAAAAENVSVEKLRVYQKLNTASLRRGREWIIYDSRPLPMWVATDGKLKAVSVAADDASQVGLYWTGVNRFLESNRLSYIEPFQGEGVRDVNGRFFEFEARPNVLRKMDAFGELNFLEIYADVAK
jgi:hypothetical protein